MAGIGGISCAFVRAETVQNLQARGEIWAVPGVNGYGSRNLGRNQSQFAFEAIGFGSSAAIEAWYAAIEALGMQVVTIVDDWNTTYSYCLLVTVGNLVKTPRVDLDGLGACRGAFGVMGVFLPSA